MTVFSEAAATSKSAGDSKWAWRLVLILSLATALAIISPFLWKGNASGHDFSFHAASWMDAAAQWRDGILLPRWTDGANHGFGEPRFIFYPPLSWMLGAALSFAVPWIYVPAVFIVLTQTLAGLSAFALGRRLLPLPGASLCAAIYAANPYALLIVYMRSDFAEQLGLVFFPLLILAALEVVGLLKSPARTARRYILILAIIFAAVWLTNAPAAVLASYSLAALFSYTAIASKSWRPLLRGSVGLALGFSLAGFYLVPAVYEQNWVNISQALSSGLQPSQNFLYTIIADTDHNVFNRVASTTAVLMIVLTAIFAVAAFPRNLESRAHPISKRVWNVLLVFSVTAAFLMLRISNVFWIALPELRFVQFPWRWMSVLAIPFTCFIAAAVKKERTRWYLTVITVTALMATLVGTATWMVGHTWWDSEDIPVLLQAIQNDEGFEGVDEYDPVGDDHSNLPEKSARFTLLRATRKPGVIADAKVHVERWSAEKKELRVTSREPLHLALRLLNYPAWVVKVNGSIVAPERAEDTLQMIVPLAEGSSQVVVQFVRTPDRAIGGIVSILSLVVLILLFVKHART
jgi:hypothetical protein